METRDRNTRVGRRARPHVWSDGRRIAQVGGAYAWTRISDLRRPPYWMTIENRQRHIEEEGTPYTISEYPYVPAPTERASPERRPAA